MCTEDVDPILINESPNYDLKSRLAHKWFYWSDAFWDAEQCALVWQIMHCIETISCENTYIFMIQSTIKLTNKSKFQTVEKMQYIEVILSILVGKQTVSLHSCIIPDQILKRLLIMSNFPFRNLNLFKSNFIACDNF